MDLKNALKSVAFGAVLATFSISSFAQWQWIDKDGRKVFSDRSPPAEIQEKDIVKRPPGSARTTAQPDGASEASAKLAVTRASAAEKPVAPKLTGKDAELEAKKKQAEDQEAAKRKAEEEKFAVAKAENCERAKNGMVTLKSGMRMSSMNAKGEQEVFDDAKRAAESKRTQEVIASNCK